ncbi:MAG TPA: four helix bundle protein [Candidatus Omnitrophota bacterium]|nr:four helix bundle protein [Candidatus Omnitrophota bacterium]
MEAQSAQNLKAKGQSHGPKAKTLLQEKSYTFSIRIIRFLEILQKDFAAQIIAKQLLRSATSIGANIIEAKGSSSKRDFANFFSYALKSANESEYWLCLLRDSKKVDPACMESLLQENSSLCRMLGASILTLRGKKEPSGSKPMVSTF